MSIGELVTPASWIRNFIVTHPKYNKDSKVTEEINYDLAKAIDEVYVCFLLHCERIKLMPNRERGVRAAPELLGRSYVGSGPTGCL